MRFMPRIQKQYLSYCEGMNDDHVKEQYKQNRKKLDLLLGELFQELFRSGTNSTIVVFTSVSGNLEGSHGLWGSCYNGYEGSIHIPCILYMPSNLPVKQRIAKENLALSTSSVDLLPTLLHMAGIDKSEIQQQLLVTHKIIPMLVGRDLCEPVRDSSAIYYQSEDVKMPLQRAVSCSVLPAAGVANENQSRSVAVLLKTSETNQHKMKICYYSSDPRSCDGMERCEDGDAEWELFDLTQDPKEVVPNGEADV